MAKDGPLQSMPGRHLSDIVYHSVAHHHAACRRPNRKRTIRRNVSDVV